MQNHLARGRGVMKKTIHCVISGIVQGVFYRAETEKKAKSLGVAGWVRNLSTGQVEVLATATPEQLEAFVAWLHTGSAMAKVDAVQYDDVELEEFMSFQVRYD